MLRKLLSLCLILFTCCASEAAGRIKIGLVKFSSPAELQKKADLITETFSKTLSASDSLTVLNRTKTAKSLSSESDVKAVSDFGKSEGCKYILLGSVNRDKDIIISVRAVDVETTRIIFSVSAASHSSNASSLRTESIKLGDRVREKITGEYPKVLSVKDKNISINRGSTSGVKKEDLYLVYKEYHENLDKDGNSAGRTVVEMAVIEIKSVGKDSSTAALFKNGGDIQIIPSLNEKRIEAISKEEAQKLIRQGNFSMKTVESKTYYRRIPDTAFLNPDALSAVPESDIQTLQRAAEAGYPEAQYYMGTIYLHRKDFPLALKWLQAAADQGYIEAQNAMGYMHENGLGVPQNYQKAFDWYLKAAGQGDVAAKNNIGKMFLYGRGVKQDYKAAEEYFRDGAEQGNAIAQANLGFIYCINAVSTGKKQNYEAAIEQLHKVVEMENKNPDAPNAKLVAMLYLGEIYYLRISHTNKASEKREYLGKAREWLEKSLEQAKLMQNSEMIKSAQDQLEKLSRVKIK